MSRKPILLFLVIFSIFSRVTAQTWNRTYRDAIVPTDGTLSCCYSEKGGYIVLVNSFFDTTYDGDNPVIRIKSNGDTVWIKHTILDTTFMIPIVVYIDSISSYDTVLHTVYMIPSADFSPTVFQLTNGDLFVETVLYDTSYSTAGCDELMRIDTNGNVVYREIWEQPFNDDPYSINYSVISNDTEGYFIYHDDTAIHSTYDSISQRIYIKKFNTINGMVLWNKEYSSFTYPDDGSYIGTQTAIYPAIATKDNELFFQIGFDTTTDGYMGPIDFVNEKIFSDGSIDWSYDANYELSEAFNMPDSSIIAITGDMDTIIDLRKYNIHGVTTDSSDISSIPIDGNGTVFSTNKILLPTETGFISFDEHLNFLAQYPYPLTEANFNSIIYQMLPNAFGGAFVAYIIYNIGDWTVNHIYAANFDSLFHTSPASITGNLYMDNNGDCTYDAGDWVMPHTPAILTGDSGDVFYAFSNDSGYYWGNVPLENYTVTHSHWPYATTTCPSSGSYTYSITAPGTYPNTNFYDQLTAGINDLQVDIYADYMIPGFTSDVYVQVSNLGTVTESDTLAFIKDPATDFISSTPAPLATSGDTIFYAINSLGYDSVRGIDIQLSVSSAATLGSSLTFIASASLASDVTPGNNTDTLSATVIGSYDPNEKIVNRPIYYNADRDLVYTIHFQNTGTWYAKNVVILDTLDSHLDVSTLKILSAKPSMPTISWNPGNKTFFTFSNINLPDSTMSASASQGEVVYSIHAKGSVAVGDSIRNTAYIYFDYNPPIPTVTTLNIVASPVTSGVNTIHNEGNIKVYPNPSSDIINIVSTTTADWQAVITDMSGRTIMSNSYSNTDHFDINLKASGGIYLLQVTNKTNGQVSVRKIVVSED